MFEFYSQCMKALLSMGLVLIGLAAMGNGLTSVQINGNSYSNISAISSIRSKGAESNALGRP